MFSFYIHLLGQVGVLDAEDAGAFCMRRKPKMCSAGVHFMLKKHQFDTKLRFLTMFNAMGGVRKGFCVTLQAFKYLVICGS